MDRRCILITGTITQNVLIAIPESSILRRNAYLQNLKYYSDVLTDPIFFLENSGYLFSEDLEFERLLKARSIGLIEFPPSHHRNEGKGYQEFEMIDHAVTSLENSFQSFIKISGRYRYRNIHDMVNNECPGITIDMYRKQKVAITSIFYSKFDFYRRYLKGLYKEVNDTNGNYIEKVIYRKLKNKLNFKTINFFPVEPDLKIIPIQDPLEDNIKHKLYRKFGLTPERKIMEILAIKELYR